MAHAKTYQKNLKKKLEKYFDEVSYERSLFKNANDILIYDPERYSPRLDLVIGPYNQNKGDDWISDFELKERLFKFNKRKTKRFFNVLSSLSTNYNPRYAVAIEIVFSGSSKHVLGDITNASVLGLYGFVITSQEMLPKAKRIFKYIQKLKQIRKISGEMYNNVKIVSTDEFDDFFN